MFNHTCNAQGLQAFSVGSSLIEINVKEYYAQSEFSFTQKQTYTDSKGGKIRVYSNAFLVHVILSGKFAASANGSKTLFTIQDTLRPLTYISGWGSGDGNYGKVLINDSGQIILNNSGTGTELNVRTSLTYPLKSKLPSWS